MKKLLILSALSASLVFGCVSSPREKVEYTRALTSSGQSVTYGGPQYSGVMSGSTTTSGYLSKPRVKNSVVKKYYILDILKNIKVSKNTKKSRKSKKSRK
jgi:hypothetical protein